MIGCIAKAASSELAADLEEMSEVRWVSWEGERGSGVGVQRLGSFMGMVAYACVAPPAMLRPPLASMHHV